MRVAIAGRHFDVTDALKAHVTKGLEKLRGHFDKVIDVDVVLSVEKHRHTAEITLHANGVRIHGKETSSDMYASVDTVLDKIDRQIRKFKGRNHRWNHGTARLGSVVAAEAEPQGTEAGTEERPPAGRPIIVRESLAMKPMSAEEAALQLGMSEEPFLVFTNSDTQQVNVLYTRDDGTYALIEPAP